MTSLLGMTWLGPLVTLIVWASLFTALAVSNRRARSAAARDAGSTRTTSWLNFLPFLLLLAAIQWLLNRWHLHLGDGMVTILHIAIIAVVIRGNRLDARRRSRMK